MHVVLTGTVTLYSKDPSITIELPTQTLKPGETFGDLSIQMASTVEQYKQIARNTIYAVADDDVHLLIFQRKAFTDHLFIEVKEHLYNKLSMLRSVPFLKDLSP